jgi:hypothetical protein
MMMVSVFLDATGMQRSRCHTPKSAHCLDHFACKLGRRSAAWIGTRPIDSVLEDFLQEIVERWPPDEHVMEPGYDRIDMLDLQLT